MVIAFWYLVVMAVFLTALLVEEQTKIMHKIANWAWDQILSSWCAMMRHTGDPIYTYKAKRYRND